MAQAPYEVIASFTDDEALTFCLSFEMADGTAFPFDEYETEYAIRKGGAVRLHLTEGAGIIITAPVITINAGNSPLRRGEYEHGLRIKHRVTGQYLQVFTGPLTIGEGEF